MKPHIHVPYDSLDKYLTFIKNEKLDLEIYFGSRTCDRLTKDDIVALKEKLDYNPALSIHSPFMDLSPGAVDSRVREVTVRRFSDVLDFAEILKPKAIVFHSGYDKWRYDGRVDIWLEGSLETWRPINKRAEAMGVRIAIENIFEDDPENLMVLARGMGSKNFGLCFDTGHFNLFSKLPLQKWLAMIKPYIVELHLHDNSRYADQHLSIGDGDFDFTALFREIQGIDCVYTIEAHTIENVKKSMEKLKTYLETP
ncbi:MAG: sugar phosphate isomerase/epimerase [Nitrospirae bacterium]|nr:sugar phosphate isomerase/epimerase [Nitrospirota bacterium]